MLPVVWLASADDDLAAIIDYIGERNLIAAERMWSRLRACVLVLSHHPCLYPASERAPGLREIVAHPNYIVLYRVTEQRVEIVNVVHARQQFPTDGL